MINLTYVCATGHDSQQYFKDRDFFLKQLKDGALECLSCGKPATSEGLSKPQVNTGISREKGSNFKAEYVGSQLYEKAMAIAQAKEMPSRPLIGTATTEQAQEIAEAGIDITPVAIAIKAPKYDA